MTTKASRKGKPIANDTETLQAKDWIRQIIGLQSLRAIFPGWPERVEVRVMEDGKAVKTRSLGKLAEVAQMSEADLVSLARTRIAEEGKA